MRSVKYFLLVVVLASLLTAVGVQALPVAAAPASAAPNCATLPGRIDALNAFASDYNKQVTAINARGGGTRDQVIYYNEQRARGIAQANALSTELAQCQGQGKLRDVKPPARPDGRQPPAPRRAPPGSAANPTPGFPAPEKYRPGQNVIRDTTTPSGGREVRFRDGGTANFPGLRGGRASGISARVSRDMLDKGSLSVSRGTGAVNPRGLGAQRPVRGHLLARILGGKGNDARNIVALTHSANGQMRTIERQVYDAIRRNPGCKLTYIVTPSFGAGPSVF